MILYIAIFILTALVLCTLIQPKKTTTEKSTEKSEEDKVKDTFTKQNVNYESANVMTLKGAGNICIAIFKNPVDHQTHFYRTRLKGENCEYFKKLFNNLTLIF